MEFACSLCEKKYKAKRDLRRHIQVKHGVNKTKSSEKVMEHVENNCHDNEGVDLNNTNNTTVHQTEEKNQRQQECDKHITKMKKEDHDEFTLKHPFTMTISGPSSCGKTFWIKTLLQNSEKYISPCPQKIIWFHKRWQPMYTEMQETLPCIEFIQGIPSSIHEDSFFDTKKATLFVFDDLMRDSVRNEAIAELWTEGSHHRNLSVVNLMQNLYEKGAGSRTMNLNNQYMVLFNNPRDKQQMAILARQMYPGNKALFMDKFNEATSKPYGYLFVDLKQDTDEGNRLKPNIFKMYSEKQTEKATYPWCIHCGSVYATMYDIQKHIQNECHEKESNDMTIGCQTFDRWFQEAKKENDIKWYELIKRYKRQGMQQKQAEDKAEAELNDQQVFINKYQKALFDTIPLEESKLHHAIVNEIERELSQGLPLMRAIAKSMKAHDHQFKELFDMQ